MGVLWERTFSYAVGNMFLDFWIEDVRSNMTGVLSSTSHSDERLQLGELLLFFLECSRA